ncbi:unnamed protein product [Fusarium graminearum]|nr:unnamed protein product [Fusarium graminearum]
MAVEVDSGDATMTRKTRNGEMSFGAQGTEQPVVCSRKCGCERNVRTSTSERVIRSIDWDGSQSLPRAVV